MKNWGLIFVISLFLIGFVIAQDYNNYYNYPPAISPNNSNGNQTNNETTNNTKNNQPAVNNSVNDDNGISSDIQSRVRGNSRNRFTEDQIKKIFTVRNEIRAFRENGTCPDKCACEGSVTRCELANGTREMTIISGNSGNVIIQIKGINATTNAILYKSDNGNIYVVLKNNETKIVRMLPDQVQEKIREKLAREFQKENITLNENGTYDYIGEENATLLFFFHVHKKISAQIDAQTGQIIEIKNPWWAFLASNNEPPILGASCGTVTPGQNDACCQSRDYDFWNATASECQFNVQNSSG